MNQSEDRNLAHETILQLIKEEHKGSMYEDILDKVIHYEMCNYFDAYKHAGTSLEKYITDYLRDNHVNVPLNYTDTYLNKIYMFIETVSQRFTPDKTAFDICLQLFNPVSILFLMYNEARHCVRNVSQKNDYINSSISELIVHDFYEVIYDSLYSNNGSLELSFSAPTREEIFTKINRLFIETDLDRCFRVESTKDKLARLGIMPEDTLENRICFAIGVLNKYQLSARDFVHCYTRFGSPIPEFNLVMDIIATINKNAPLPKKN